jgi:hypothetical protein
VIEFTVLIAFIKESATELSEPDLLFDAKHLQHRVDFALSCRTERPIVRLALHLKEIGDSLVHCLNYGSFAVSDKCARVFRRLNKRSNSVRFLRCITQRVFDDDGNLLDKPDKRAIIWLLRCLS